MTALAKILSGALGTRDDVEMFQALVIFCGSGLVASLLGLLSGLNISAG